MRDVDDLLRSLGSPEPPPSAPAWPSRRPRLWAVAGLLLAASVFGALWIGTLSPGGAQLRGVADEHVELDLRMVVERGGVAVRVSSGSTLYTGERVLFRVASERAASVRVWVEQPQGAATIATLDAAPSARDVGAADGLIGYRFDAPGRYVFHLTPTSGECSDCPALSVEVR